MPEVEMSSDVNEESAAYYPTSHGSIICSFGFAEKFLQAIVSSFKVDN